jgi:penicillin-binding protein 2
MLNNKLSKKVLIGILLIPFSLFIFRLADLQILQGNSNLIRSSNLANLSTELKPKRGLFFDSNNNLLVKNKDTFTIVSRVTKEYSPELNDFLDAVESKGVQLVEPKEKILSQLDNNRGIILARYIDSDTLYTIQDLISGIKDIYVIPSNSRVYLHPYEYSHILGYIGSVTNEELEQGYSSTDVVGKYKLELSLEQFLKGAKGEKRTINGIDITEDSMPGDNVYLTINTDWQTNLYNILGRESDGLGAAGGAGVIVEDSTGKIKSLVSYPGIDINQFSEYVSQDYYNQITSDRRKPLLDKAISQPEAPGSTIKLLTAYYLLENRVIDSNTNYFSNRCVNLGSGYEFCEFGKLFYGNMNIERALYKSSNLFFCNYMIGEGNGTNYSQGLSNIANLFNIGEKTGIDLPGELSGVVDSPKYKQERVNDNWYDGDTCNLAIGQGANLITPLQMAMVAATISNDGKYYQPYIIEEIKDIFGNIKLSNSPSIKKEIPFNQSTIDLIKSGMEQVASNSDSAMYYFLGDSPGNPRVKTGTAEVYENTGNGYEYRTHGWIVGTFDYQDESYSFAFHLSYGGGGFYIGKVLQVFLNCIYSNYTTCE